MSDTKTAPAAKTFADFGVEPAICESLAALGIVSPFPIQEMTLPLALSGADIIGQARTGTGKTLGFGLPLLQRIDINGGLQALVIVPTRELCLQVSEDLAEAGKGRGVDVLAVYGGKAIQPQIDAIADGAHLVVGTPGRLLDLSRRGFLDLSQVAGLVLDEADEMLDLGFLPDVEALIEQCSEERQTLLFSATMPAAIVGLARRYMSKPTFMRADVEEINIAPQTQQYFFSCHRMDKPAVVARILQTPKRGLCVIFCRTKRMADILAEELRDRDVAAQAIHSDLRQDARERVMQKFREGKVTVLCATEVAARGLDIDDVTHVVNYDCPDDEKMYLHRIGRTGRAGADGVAITFAVWNELPRLEMIRRELDITDEIHEVFSTSPLLDELFDLPAREERTKVASPPQSRSKSPRKSRDKDSEDSGRGRSKRRNSDDSSDTASEAKAERGARGKTERGSGDKAERSSGDKAERGSRNTTDRARTSRTEDDGNTRRRTRTRTGAGRSDDVTTDQAAEKPARRSSSTEADDGANAPRGGRGQGKDEDEAQGGRRRRSRGGRGRGESTAETTDTASTAGGRDDAGSRSSADESGSAEDSSTRTRTRTRSDRDERSQARAAGDAPRAGRSDEAAGERSPRTRSNRGESGDRSNRGESGDRSNRNSRGRTNDAKRSSNDGNRTKTNDSNRTKTNDSNRTKTNDSNRTKTNDSNRTKTNDGNRAKTNDSNRTKTSGGRDGRGRTGSEGSPDRDGNEEGARGQRKSSGNRSGRGNEGRSSRGRSSDRGSGGGRNRGSGVKSGNGRSAPAVDHDEARGDGKPRLSRKLEVEHLP